MPSKKKKNKSKHSNSNSEMAEKLPTPTFCTDVNSYETFKKELDIWSKITKIPKKSASFTCSTQFTRKS